MLKLPPRRATSYTCPFHPRQQYLLGDPPPTCDTCRAIAQLLAESAQLDRAERNAISWIARSRVRAGS